MIRLETERLLFRDHEPADLEDYLDIESDALYRAPQTVHPRGQLERRFRQVLLQPKELGLCATILKATGRYVGRCGLYPFRNSAGVIQPGEAFIAFYIGRAFWGQGIATEAGQAWIGYGFDQLGLRRIEAGVNVENAASIRVVEKLGFHWIRSGGTGPYWNDYELKNPRT